MPRRTIHSTVAVVMSALSLASCSSTTTAAIPAPLSASGSVTVPAPTSSEPDAITQRIIPVDGDLAEIVFALGLGDSVTATDISATYPPAADLLPEIGYQRALSSEPIAALEPTIVLATDAAGPATTLDELERLGIEVQIIETPSTADGPGQKIRAVADALGTPDVGAELANSVDQEIQAAIERATAAPTAPKVGVLYVRGNNVQLILGEGSGVDWLIDAAGGVDIADELGIVGNAPINTEALIAAAPDVLVVPSRGLESVGGMEGLLSLGGISETPAGKTGRILVYDDQYLLGNGPRTGQFLNEFITDLHGDFS